MFLSTLNLQKTMGFLMSCSCHNNYDAIIDQLPPLKGVFHGSAHVLAYQLHPFKKPHLHVLLDASVITYYILLVHQ